MRPVLYPSAILVAYVLNVLVDTGVSPYAAGRPLIVALLVGFLVVWLAALATADRDRAGLLALILVVMVLAAGNRMLVVLSLVAFTLVALQPFLRRSPGPSAAPAPGWLPIATRLLKIGSLILLVAVGIKAVQLGRVETFAQDLVAEFPLRPHAVVAGPASTGAPNMFFILLDGYPRGDKLSSEAGIDNSAFVSDLRARDFVVADHSRSNQVRTDLTLAQMFNYRSATEIAHGLDGANRLWRVDINGGAFFADLNRLGYETVAVSSGFEHVALRRADLFLDTGQFNEFEWAIVGMTGLSLLADAVIPDLAADAHRSRILDAFNVAERQAQSLGTGPKFLLVHVAAPHAPQVFDAAGLPNDVSGFNLPYSDPAEITRLGFDEYARRLGGQLEFLNQRTIQLVDSVVAADPGAVVVVFSDHGSGAPSRGPGETYPYADLHTANLLAVRSPGKPGIIDDRSTLANLLPRLLRKYTGTGPPEVPETIYVLADEPDASFVFARPD
jgi:hypothetical protein